VPRSFDIDTDRARLDRALIHRYLGEDSYWARGVPRAVLDRAIDHSLCFGAYRDGAQVGFARVISDHATFAYLADVFVLEAERGNGCAHQLLQAVLAHPHLQGLRRFALATRDAHALYARYGFAPLARPETFMERYHPDVYRAGS
jgi:GNAT superfamily N-acetyltransferase